MQHACDRTLWRTSFIDALQLVGAAAVRLPVGEPDPVLCGESAVELYTGGLWATDALELSVVQPHLLIAELFAVGFRWTHSPRYVGRGLWHPELQMGVKISDDCAPLGPAERANLLTIAMDDDRAGPVPRSLKVMGIEDVIAEQAASWRAHRAPSAQMTTRVQVLVALAHRGIGGPFRAVICSVAWPMIPEARLRSRQRGLGRGRHTTRRRARWRSAVWGRSPTAGAS